MTDGPLPHVRWLGGGSGAGKSTIAGLLANSFDLRVYDTDATIATHGADSGPDAPLLEQFRSMSMDERWVGRDASTMLHSFPWFAGERFDRIVSDLRARPPAPVTLAEGFRVLPRLVRPLLAERWHAVWLIPTAEFRRAAFARRTPQQQFWLRTSDPAKALDHLLDRDALFADSVAREAEQVGLHVIAVDGTRTETELAAEVARWFGLQ